MCPIFFNFPPSSYVLSKSVITSQQKLITKRYVFYAILIDRLRTHVNSAYRDELMVIFALHAFIEMLWKLPLAVQIRSSFIKVKLFTHCHINIITKSNIISNSRNTPHCRGHLWYQRWTWVPKCRYVFISALYVNTGVKFGKLRIAHRTSVTL